MNLIQAQQATDFQSAFAFFQPNLETFEQSTLARPAPSPRAADAKKAASSDAEFENAIAPSSGRDNPTVHRDPSSSAAIALGLAHPSILPAYGPLVASIDRPSAVHALLFLFKLAAAFAQAPDTLTRPFIVSFEDSGATSLEWLFTNARLVFAFEPDGSGTYSFCKRDDAPRFGDITRDLPIEELLSRMPHR